MRAERRILPVLALTAVFMGAAACDDEEPEGPSPTIAVAVSPTSLSVQQGQSGTATVTLTRGGDFAGAVSLSVEGAPTGVTATVTPTSLTGATTTAQVTVNVGSSAAAGASTLTVRASGSGVTDATATLGLTVTAAPAGSYTLAVNPTSATVTQGGSTTATVTLTRTNNFAGEVTLAATGLPSGVTATFDPAATAGNTSTVTLNASASAATGASTVTITGTAAGLADMTTTLALTVNEATTGGNVTWTFCPAAGVPAWVAYQDDDGDWVRAMEGDDNTYAMQFDGDRGGVAYAVNEDDQANVYVFYGARAELEAQGGNLCEGTGATKTVNGSVAGLGATDQAYITMGSATAIVLSAVGTDFTLEEVEDGPQDLIAARVSIDVSGEDPSLAVDRLIFRRNLNPENDATLDELDFEGQEAFEPELHEVTVTNDNGDQTYVLTGYFTENGAASAFFTGLPTAGTAMTYAGVPAAQQEAGDLHLLSVVAVNDPENPTATRIVQEMFMAAADKMVTLGPDLDAVTVTSITNDPYPRLQAAYSPQDEYDRYFIASFSQTDRQWLISATQDYFGAGNDVELAVPDFTGTDGWDPDAWALEAGVQTDWFFSASGWDGEDGIVTSPFEEGGVFRTATQMGTITP